MKVYMGIGGGKPVILNPNTKSLQHGSVYKHEIRLTVISKMLDYKNYFHVY